MKEPIARKNDVETGIWILVGVGLGILVLGINAGQCTARASSPHSPRKYS